MLCIFTVLLLVADVVLAHGRLVLPPTRYPEGYENDPVPYDDDTFVCRNPLTDPATTISAGSQLQVQWEMSAPHVGDCAFYISYDYDLVNSAQKYFKIANWYNCEDVDMQEVTIDIPNWLPGGRAILRWDWIALHVYPSAEFFVQCADVIIEAAPEEVTVDSLVTYSIIDPPLYPKDALEGVGYRNPYGSGEQYFTGPACANGYNANLCGLSAAGTTGNIEVPVTTTTPSPTSEGETSEPTFEPTYKPDCETYIAQPGDTLYDIAAAYTAQGMDVTADEICEFNHLPDCAVIHPGDDLSIPCDTCGCSQCCSCTEEEVSMLGSSTSNVPDSIIGFLISTGVLSIILSFAMLFILCVKWKGLVLSNRSVDGSKETL